MADQGATPSSPPAGPSDPLGKAAHGASLHEALDLWRRVVLSSVRAEAPDLTQRQMSILLTVYLDEPPHTVRGLAEALGVTKPVITRALDSLGQLGLLKRKRDEADRRNVLVQRTVKGSLYLNDFADLIRTALPEADLVALGLAARKNGDTS